MSTAGSRARPPSTGDGQCGRHNWVAKLPLDSLEFARHHVQKYWDSDFFPTRPEFKALWACWPDVADHLGSTDLGELPVSTPRLQAAPRPDGSYRVVHQLDPLNTLAYTALGAASADLIESNRTPVEDCVACSYRLELEQDRGNFFATGNGFEVYATRSRELAEKRSWVLVTDISDFYNQISVHRVRNALETAGGEAAVLGADAETFLLRLNSKTSKGIPVGPASSILLAEAILADIDAFLANAGATHTRYVDDFRLFADSREWLDALLQQLTVYLYSTHRLSLAPGKTFLVRSNEFVTAHLDAPIQLRRRQLHGVIDTIAAHYAHLESPDADQQLSGSLEDESPRVRRNRLVDLMEGLCEMEKLDLGIARHVLRTCRRYRLRAIVPLLLEHFDSFAPVLNDVVVYLDRVSSRGFLEYNGDRIHELCADSATAALPFGRMWLAELVARSTPLLKQRRFRQWVYQSGEFTAAATASIALRDVAWVRAQRGRIDELGPWDRRDLIRASTILPRDERGPWLRALRENPLPLLERCMVSWAAGQP